MPDAFRAWKQLEADAGRPLYVRTGGISFSPKDVDYTSNVAANLEAGGIPFRRMTGKELKRSLPQFGMPDDYDVVFEPDAGFLCASACVQAQARLAREFGGDRTTILEETKVESIDLDGPRPVLKGDGWQIEAERLIVTAGAWTPQLVPSLKSLLTPTHQQVLYLQPEDPNAYAIGRFPVFIYKGHGEHNAFYGFPPHLGMAFKVARHGGPKIDPDAKDRSIGDEYRAIIRKFLAENIPGMADRPIVHEEVCLYTMAPDEAFQVDFLKGRSDVVVASPCSGHGFKFACLVGRVLADLATSGTTEIDRSAWAMA